jgi:dolichol-phosphate mannosyltransferase
LGLNFDLMNRTAREKKISIIIPVYNEESNIEKLFYELHSVLSSLHYAFEVIFVDDGSEDGSLLKVRELTQKHDFVFFIELSRNFGHQHALKAGLDFSQGDCAITMDGDLQHPPSLIPDLIQKWEQGSDIVFTRRKEDKKLSWFKRKTSLFFYSLINKLSDLKLENGTADFRLMDRKVLNAFAKLRENELFLRGLIKWSGFRQVAVDYTPHERHSGKTKYSLFKMISLAFNAVTAFSTRPLKLIAYIGLTLFLFSLCFIPYVLISYFMDKTISGWTSLMMVVIFFGSLQLLILGIIGLYFSKMVIQSKQRPLYFVRDTNYPNPVN